jgi:hypothetical protein
LASGATYVAARVQRLVAALVVLGRWWGDKGTAVWEATVRNSVETVIATASR